MSSVDIALNSILAGNNYLITGAGGSGKSTLIHSLSNFFDGVMIKVAPTALAALNINASTAHKIFGLDLKKEYAAVLKSDSFQILVLDECSMIRSDKLQEIDWTLKKYKNNNLPFGGVQVLMFGDPLQLSPVVKQDERKLLLQHYKSEFFFDSQAFIEANFEHIKLEAVYRQTDEELKNKLENIRLGINDKETLDYFNVRCYNNQHASNKDNVLQLCATNHEVDMINSYGLNQLNTPIKTFKAVRRGLFKETPVAEEVSLRVGAKVMICVNHSELKYVNGSQGIIKKLYRNGADIELDNGEEVNIECNTWYNYEPYLSKKTGRIEDRVIGEYRQLPLKLAYALTGHKSQGQTFKEGVLNLGTRPLFGFGLCYVMLSRFTDLDNLRFTRPLNKLDIKQDNRVLGWYEKN
jgi:ATP-dependent DNA helicase PIF1